MESFPRELYNYEKEILFSILPESKNGYKKYRQRIPGMKVIGQGRFGGGNLVLGFEGDEVELDIPSASVFSSGVVKCNEIMFDVIIHKEEEEQIEYDISPFGKLNPGDEIKIESVASLSHWSKDENSPYTKLPVKEFIVLKDKYILVIDASAKKIWMNDMETGINHIIPLTNFYNELMRFKNIREQDIALKPGRFFDDVDKYSDDDIVSAFLMYDKYMNRFNLQQKIFPQK
jgi:hypothetical protein